MISSTKKILFQDNILKSQNKCDRPLKEIQAASNKLQTSSNISSLDNIIQFQSIQKLIKKNIFKMENKQNMQQSLSCVTQLNQNTIKFSLSTSKKNNLNNNSCSSHNLMTKRIQNINSLEIRNDCIHQLRDHPVQCQSQMIAQHKQYITELIGIINQLKSNYQDQKQSHLREMQKWNEEKKQLMRKLTILQDKNKLLYQDQKKERTLRVYNYSEQQQQDIVYDSLVQKVVKLSQQLNFFIKTSLQYKHEIQTLKHLKLQNQNHQHLLNNQITQLNQLLLQKEKQQQKQKQTYILSLNHLQTQNKQKQQTLSQQITRYKHEYQSLKKKHLIMQSQWKKYQQSQQTQQLQNKYSKLLIKYNYLYDSYKSLYDQFITSQSSSSIDFIQELNQSNQASSSSGSGRMGQSQQGVEQSQLLLRRNIGGGKHTLTTDNNLFKQLKHKQQQNCSYFMNDSSIKVADDDQNKLNIFPISFCGMKSNEQINQLRVMAKKIDYHPKIILKDLIKQTLQHQQRRP